MVSRFRTEVEGRGSIYIGDDIRTCANIITHHGVLSRWQEEGFILLLLLLLEADELVHLINKVLAGGQLAHGDGVGAPLAAGVGLGGTPGIDRPEVGSTGFVLEGDDGGAGHADAGPGDVVDLEVRLVPGQGEAGAAAVEEGLGAAAVVRDEQIRGGLDVPAVLVRAVLGGVAADAEGLGIGPFRRGEADLAISIQKVVEREASESLCESRRGRYDMR